ncbi:type VI secretion system-associated protein VasI [Marinobacter nanhaiticus D15-8W]|uniref:Type VI secretion system-associated protein TagO n=1 Tax=Marinobacter nanhaiticus D15-8W TaxID=626887 RepID=N6WV68_9GAMM|nr:type VI secretion system-associated protein VasI [Marinobacter nanhaiticus]ENO15486.1 type VI secretion system-associated protein TagO [Marinobacter nanhaiticus D15-8W]BES73664.1 type VI secretion system-associated protein VasI [Marinobacter nanhaiticus D15-8W]
MKSIKQYTLWAALMVGCSGVASGTPADDAFMAAQECTQETARLERLACFDAVFETPVHAEAEAQAVMPGRQPNEWLAAYAQETRRTPEDGALRGQGDAGEMVTLPALGAVPPRPLLTVRCDNNITHFALMLPKPTSAERVRMTLTSGATRQAQMWRVRDDGFVVSGGRGLPAIDTIKTLINASSLALAAGESAVDGLVFDLAGLREALGPLRKQCGW